MIMIIILKAGYDVSRVTERVSIKMVRPHNFIQDCHLGIIVIQHQVARKEDGTVVKKTFKPIEDSGRSSVQVDTFDISDYNLRK